MDRPAFAPWLPRRKRKRCLRFRWWIGCVGSLLLLAYMMVMGLLLFICKIPGWVLQLLLVPAAERFGYVVEYAYSLGVCRFHVALERFTQRYCFGRPYHSRCLDIRSEFALKPRGVCYVHPVPCMSSNYSYLIVDASKLGGARNEKCGLRCCLVDPCDADGVVELVDALSADDYKDFGGLVLEAVLCTHKHWDHAGGNRDLRQWAAAANAASNGNGNVTEQLGSASSSHPEPVARLRYADALRVYGGYDDDIPGRTHPLEHGEVFKVGALEFEALATPGHTAGSMVFGLKNVGEASGARDRALTVLFTGDCLFSGGCGAPFEGSQLDMEHCFASILHRSDPERTLLFPGHEYTNMMVEDNFSKPGRSTLESPPGHFLSVCADYYSVCHRRGLHDKIPTVPCTVVGEQQMNPIFQAVQRRAQSLLEILGEIHRERASANTDVASDDSVKFPSLPPHLRETATIEGVAQRNVEEPQPQCHGDTNHSRCVEPMQKYVMGGRQSQLTFMYRFDLENLREGLRTGAVSAADAADRLTQLERNVFETSVLTGDDDGFEGQVFDDDVHSDDEAAEVNVQDTAVEARASVTATAAPSEGELRHREQVLSKALRVLGVPAAVPLGRKAPCADSKLPVDVFRIVSLLERLGVPVADKRLAILQRALNGKQTAMQGVVPHGEGLGSNGSVQEAAIGSQVPDGSSLIPLAEALHALCPVPVHSRWARVLRLLRALKSCCGGICGLCNRQADEHDAAGDSSGPSGEQQAEPDKKQAGGDDAVREHRKKFSRFERGFTRHKVDKCPICRGSFAPRVVAPSADAAHIEGELLK